jgi:hypothetical protein
MMRVDGNEKKTIHENDCIACKETAVGKSKYPSTKFGVPIVLRSKTKKEQQ